MKALIRKNQLIRDHFKKSELSYLALKAIVKSNILTPLDKDSLRGIVLSPDYKDVIQLPHLSKVRNICVSTGRTRALIQDYKIARNSFKNLAELGYLPGIKKR